MVMFGSLLDAEAERSDPVPDQWQRATPTPETPSPTQRTHGFSSRLALRSSAQPRHVGSRHRAQSARTHIYASRNANARIFL
eukprot:5616815-Prymnesium_polylepis.1